MNTPGSGDSVSLVYVPDDKQRREAFDHQLAGYVRGHCERWDITAIVELLDLLGRRTGQVDVGLGRQPDGTLSVTMTFALAPHRS